MAKLIADSGSTKCEWCLVMDDKKKSIITQGISPYFLSGDQIRQLISELVFPKIKKYQVDEIFYYGTGCKSPANRRTVQTAIRSVFPQAEVHVDHDLMGAARALCGKKKGIACILGTGSNSCYFNGKTIVKNSPGLGYVLGDEGSGACLGKMVLQYYLYNKFDEELNDRFTKKFNTNNAEILENVYQKPLPNRYLASFTVFLAENRHHFIVENILEDGIGAFFFQHLSNYRESNKLPIHFVGGVAHAFRDVIEALCIEHEYELGSILKNPMEGLIQYHSG